MIPGEIITKSTEVEINNHHPETVIDCVPNVAS